MVSVCSNSIYFIEILLCIYNSNHLLLIISKLNELYNTKICLGKSKQHCLLLKVMTICLRLAVGFFCYGDAAGGCTHKNTI